MFSLAAIAFELLTGRRPSGTGDDIGPLTGDHLLEFGAGMRVVLARAMDEDPGRRYPSALAFASALEAAAHGGRVSEAITAVGAISAASAGGAREAAAARAGSESGRAGLTAPASDDDGEALEQEADDLPLGERADHGRLVDEDDISSERDEDAAYYEVTRMQEPAAAREPTLFDDEGGDAIAGAYAGAGGRAPARPYVAHDAAGAYGGDAATAGADDYGARAVATDTERPRPAALPIAVTLILGLLVGFAAGYWIGSRGPARATVAGPAQAAPSPQTAADAAAPGPSPRASGQPFTEPAAGAPPSTPPAVPDDEPPAGGRQAAAPRDAATARRAAAPAATTGRLVVTSTPSRAAVTIDGKWRGRTPLTLNRLTLGKYSVRVVSPGFEVTTEEVTLTGSTPSRTVALRLQRAAPAARAPAAARPAAPSNAFTGSVYVDSRPRGARILIDGRPMGTTPARIPELSIGSHVVRLELAEHRAWTTATRVAAGAETRVAGSLERIR